MAADQEDPRAQAAGKPTPEPRAAFAVFRTMTTRWRDNDVYGHINNTVYYEYFDSVVNGWMIEQGVLDIENSQAIGLVVATACDYFEPIVFPDTITGGLRADRIGRSSVTYSVALFRNDGDVAAAQGRFTHVFVDRSSRRPAPLPDDLRAALRTVAAPV